MADSISGGFKLSNITLLGLTALLGAGILLDGTLYNQPTPKLSIYPINAPSSVEVLYAEQAVLAFEKSDQQWQQTKPIPAPAHQQRIQALLDTNKLSPRKYASADLPVDEIFKEPITLKLNGSRFDFGTIEPVSKLRYVRANGEVYLQPDIVLPLLNAVNNAFVDLKITDKVESVTIGDTKFTEPDIWSHLQAIDVTPNATDRSNPGLKINVVQDGHSKNLTAHLTEIGAILSNENGFDYLLNDKTAESLGLTDLMLPDKP